VELCLHTTQLGGASKSSREQEQMKEQQRVNLQENALLISRIVTDNWRKLHTKNLFIKYVYNKTTNTQTNSVALIPQANYTD
jgi:hypothetical protein